jgi:hypothetical protein
VVFKRTYRDSQKMAALIHRADCSLMEICPDLPENYEKKNKNTQ